MILTAHPLQRVGAYALACLGVAECPASAGSNDAGGVIGDPVSLTAAGFDAAVAVMTEDAVRAAVGRDAKAPEGFFLKSSWSVFPNSKMNHLSNAKRGDTEITERVRQWRSRPAVQPGLGAGVPCTLCSEPAVGFYGKVDVPLAESDAYRNNTPRGHEGMALCWACLCCFYALPYGSRLTGGPCLALHSWDEGFLASTVAAQVTVTRQVIEVGAERQGTEARDVLALRALRRYEQRLTAGVELLVFSNNNRGQTLDVFAMDQAMAEWLRRTLRLTALRRGFGALLRAHRTVKEPGYVGLARNAFRSPERIPATCARYLATMVETPQRSGEDQAGESAALAALCFDYADKVMLMDASDGEEIRATGRRIAVLIQEESGAGKLREFYARFKDAARLRAWLQRSSVEWVIKPRPGQDGPLLTTRGFGLLFDPDLDNPAWFHRQLLLVAVVEELYVRGWRPEVVDDTEELPEFEAEEQRFVAGGGGEDQR